MRTCTYLKMSLFSSLFLLPSFGLAKDIKLTSATLSVNNDWDAYKYEGGDTVFLRNSAGSEIVFTVKHFPGPKDPKTLDYMLEHHLEYERKVFPRDINGFTGYFIPFEVDKSCRANWFLEGDELILNVGYKSDCNNIHYDEVESIITSLKVEG